MIKLQALYLGLKKKPPVYGKCILYCSYLTSFHQMNSKILKWFGCVILHEQIQWVRTENRENLKCGVIEWTTFSFFWILWTWIFKKNSWKVDIIRKQRQTETVLLLRLSSYAMLTTRELIHLNPKYCSEVWFNIWYTYI